MYGLHENKPVEHFWAPTIWERLLETWINPMWWRSRNVNQYLTGSLLIATFESWSLTFSIPWALDFTWERWRSYVQNNIQHTRLRVWLVGLVGGGYLVCMGWNLVMDLVGCRHVEEVEFESEGWNLKAKVGSLSNKPLSPTNHESVRQFPCWNTSDEVVSNWWMWKWSS